MTNIQPATDDQIASMEREPADIDWSRRVPELIARIRQEQARADKNLAIARDEEAHKLNAEQEVLLLRELAEALMLTLTDLWHESGDVSRLHEFCGISWERYKAWVERKI